jgi:hypothetical protein
MSENDASSIAIDNSRVTLQIASSITVDSRGIIYNHNMFIVQAKDYCSK